MSLCGGGNFLLVTVSSDVSRGFAVAKSCKWTRNWLRDVHCCAMAHPGRRLGNGCWTARGANKLWLTRQEPGLAATSLGPANAEMTPTPHASRDMIDEAALKNSMLINERTRGA